MATALCPAPTQIRTRPQIADILRDHGIGACRTRQQRKAVADILACRTGALGGHVERCPCCAYSRTVFRSCCNRHCPTCICPLCISRAM